MPKALCGVPAEHCASNGTHLTCVAAFNCHVEYLLRMGYHRISKREFIETREGRVVILAKPKQFGGVSRDVQRNRASRRRLEAIRKQYCN